jgi:general L-amino acid transport system permease protein
VGGQVLAAALVLAGIGAVIWNALSNLETARINTGFRFLNEKAGFDISQHIIAYNSQTSSYLDALLVGLTNTVLVALCGIVLATIFGFVVGLARTSSNLVVAAAARIYVELFRNVPLLLQLLFWYNAVLKPLPPPRSSVDLGGVFLNNRGLFVPELGLEPRAILTALTIAVSAIGAAAYWRYSRRRYPAEKSDYCVLAALCIVLLAVGGSLTAFQPMHLEWPTLSGLSFRGGLQIAPEFIALLIGLSIYTSAFIAEVVRAGIFAVDKGQIEAASALGLGRWRITKLIAIPQALRVIIPPLTNQYVGLIKNSSLAVIIGYPDLVQVFAGTVLNQTGQAIEVIMITLVIYTALSLSMSFLMNIYNKRSALVER